MPLAQGLRLGVGALPIVLIHELDERPPQQLGGGVPEEPLERAVHLPEIAVEPGRADQVAGQQEDTVELLTGPLACLKGLPCAEGQVEHSRHGPHEADLVDAEPILARASDYEMPT